MQEKKCFRCGEFGHIVRNYRKKNEKKVTIQSFSNKFEVLLSKVMKVGILSEGEIRRNIKIILREEKVKKEKQIKKKEETSRSKKDR